jgi:pyruvate,water dikinase
LRRLLLRWLQRRTRALVSNRENLRFERTRVFGLARRLLLELGRRLAGLGLLDQPEDVVFLEVEEVLGVVEGNGSGADLRGLVVVRRAAWQRQRQQRPLPRRMETRGLPALATAALLAAPELPAETGEGMADPAASSAQDWQGTGCAPGLVRARVSLVGDPRRWLDTPRQRGSDRPILVAASTDPGWVLLFPHAAGLLVERGSVLSHVAIVARELGLPMVTDLGGITACLAEGDWVEMDGRSGAVRCLAAAPHGAETAGSSISSGAPTDAAEVARSRRPGLP